MCMHACMHAVCSASIAAPNAARFRAAIGQHTLASYHSMAQWAAVRQVSSNVYWRKPYQQADAALVVRAGLCNVAVLARVPPASILMRVRIAAALPWVRALDGAWLDLHVRSTGQHAHGVLICRFRNPERLKLCRQPATPVLCPGWEVSVLCMLHVIYSKDVLWLLMPVFGVKPACPPKLPWCSNFACMELVPNMLQCWPVRGRLSKGRVWYAAAARHTAPLLQECLSCMNFHLQSCSRFPKASEPPCKVLVDQRHHTPPTLPNDLHAPSEDVQEGCAIGQVGNI